MRTITKAFDIDRLFKHGRRATLPLLTLLVLPSPPGRGSSGGVVFVAGRKLGGAVFRNRCKRVMREAVRRAGGPWEGLDVALVARAGIAKASPAEIDDSLARLLARTDIS